MPVAGTTATQSTSESAAKGKAVSDQVARLQAAVREMLYELNIYQEQESIGSVREVALDTLETYGLTKEDME